MGNRSRGKVSGRFMAGLLCVSLFTASNVSMITEVSAQTPEAVNEVKDIRMPETAKIKGRQLEILDRGVLAIKTKDGVYLSWRFLGTDTTGTAFHIYRDGEKITEEPVTGSTNYQDASGTLESVYEIHTLLDGEETENSGPVSVLADNYFDIPIQVPEPGVTPAEEEYTYSANDASCGDIDGDGEYEIILKWMPSNSGDNMADGYRGNVYIDAYELDGTKLWRIDMGVNIRAGAHYTQFMVYDFDGDGRAEMVCKTADGTTDGLGTVIGDAEADYRSTSGTILDGPEYLTLFDGMTGKAIDTIDYEPGRGPNGVLDADYWGDDFGNRSERYLAAVAYLNGKTPSVLMCRGYYKNFGIAAYDIVDKKFVKRWFFDTADEGNAAFAGQGNHNLAVADVDEDGYDEIVYGSCTIDHDGTGLYSNEFGHGDAIHVSDFDPDSPGLEIFGCLEHEPYGIALRKASNGEIIFRFEAEGDTGRGLAGNFTADNPGAEYASSMDDNIYNSAGEVVGSWKSFSKWYPNFTIYWDGDLEQEVMERTMIDKYGVGRVFTAPSDVVTYNNSSKGNSCLAADLFGDWREEVIWRAHDSSFLRVYCTTDVTEYKIATLMHDSQYRVQIASQNVGYNQPAHTSFFLGTGYPLPEIPEKAEEPDEPENPETPENPENPEDQNKTKLVEEISLRESSRVIEAGEQYTIDVSIKPQNADNKEVEITSNNPAVAEVSGNKVIAKSAGESVITVTTKDGSNKSVTLSLKVVLGKTKNISAVQLADKCYANVQFEAVAGAKQYEVYRSTAPSTGYNYIGTTANTSYTDKKVKTGKTYYYKVKAKGSNALYDGAFSTTYAELTVLAKPSSVKASRIKATKGKVSWKKVKGASGYGVYVSSRKSSGFKLAKTIKKSSTVKTNIKISRKWKKVYVRVRPFSLKNGKPVYGTYSKTVTCKAK